MPLSHLSDFAKENWQQGREVAQLVECKTGDRRVAGSSLTASRVTVLCP